MFTQYHLLFLGLCSLVLSLILTPLCRNLFLQWNVVDRADGHRKFHQGDIPRVGGIPILLSYGGAFLILLLFLGDQRELLSVHNALLWQVLPAAGIVFLTGLVDDLIGLRPWQKLLGQVIGAGWAYWTGIRVTGITGFETAEFWSLPLTLLWLVGCTNAFNLIDGVDGLASGVGLFAACTTLLAALLQGNVGLAIAIIPLVGCLLGFLRYNFNPASIFLGDCGSLGVGFLLGCYGVIWSQKSATLLGMVAPMMALALPLLDTSLSIVRRFLRNQPIFGADRGHIHHRLLARGLKPRTVALVLYAVCGVAAILSLMQSVLYNSVGGFIIVLFCGAAWIGVQNLGYIEFGVAREMFTGGSFRRTLQEEIRMRHLRAELGAAPNVEEFWKTLCAAAREFQFLYVELQVARLTFQERIDPKISESHWDFDVTLSDTVHLKLHRISDPTQFVGVFSFVEAVQVALEGHSWFDPQAKVVPIRGPRRVSVVPPSTAADVPPSTAAG